MFSSLSNSGIFRPVTYGAQKQTNVENEEIDKSGGTSGIPSRDGRELLQVKGEI
jgi:hypothetical protein